MLTRLIDFAIAQRWLMVFLSLLLVVAGLIALVRLPFDAFPDTTPVLVQVNVSAPGWAPEEVERQITYPVERRLSGLTGLIEVRSISKYGLSQINLVFRDDIDLYLARQQATERLVGVELPFGVPAPQLGPISTGLGEVFHYVLLGSPEDPSDVRTVQDWIVKPQLQAVPGVAEVNSWGGFEKQYQVLFDPNRLVQYSLTLTEVVEHLRENIGNVPGGEMIRGGEQTLVRGIGVVSDRKQIEEIVVAERSGSSIHVHDVADVVIGHEIRRGATTYNGQGEVVLGLGFMLTGENSRDVTKRLAAQLEDVKRSLPAGIEAKIVYQRTDLVDEILATVRRQTIRTS